MSASNQPISSGDKHRITDNGKTSNVRLMLRLLGLAWNYRWSTVRLLLLQVMLLGLALTGLGLLGVAIDVIHEGFDPRAKPADWPFGLKPPVHYDDLDF